MHKRERANKQTNERELIAKCLHVMQINEAVTTCKFN